MKNRSQSDTLREKQVRKGERSMLTEQISGADPGFGQGGGPASEAKSCRRSEAESCERSEHSVAGVQGPLKGPGNFWVFDAQICILTHSRDSFSLIFDIYFDTKSW